MGLLQAPTQVRKVKSNKTLQCDVPRRFAARAAPERRRCMSAKVFGLGESGGC